MGRVIYGARRVPADAHAARGEAQTVREAARVEAQRIVEAARREAEELRTAARRRGREEGLASVAGALAEARGERARAAQLREPEIADLALAVARRVVRECRALDPGLAARRAAELVRERFLGPVLVRVAPGDADGLRRALAAAGRAEAAVTVREDPQLRTGILVLEGDGGAIRLDDDEMLYRLAGALAEDGNEAAP